MNNEDLSCLLTLFLAALAWIQVCILEIRGKLTIYSGLPALLASGIWVSFFLMSADLRCGAFFVLPSVASLVAGYFLSLHRIVKRTYYSGGLCAIKHDYEAISNHQLNKLKEGDYYKHESTYVQCKKCRHKNWIEYDKLDIFKE